jgi:hypothetical protein
MVLNVNHEIVTALTRAELARLLRKMERGSAYAWEAYVGDSRADRRLSEISAELNNLATYLRHSL